MYGDGGLHKSFIFLIFFSDFKMGYVMYMTLKKCLHDESQIPQGHWWGVRGVWRGSCHQSRDFIVIYTF